MHSSFQYNWSICVFVCVHVYQCAYLEASNCQKESRYLGVLRKLQENKELNAEQRAAIKKLIEEALQADQKDVIRIDTVR